jgi:LysR family transcriptional regulator, hydrogen peroxide-inducible genes activator
MITLRQLRYLAALAEHRHFGRAAQACAVTQPALSMQIRELEKALGAELVERRPNEIVLTELGCEIARRCDGILAAVRDLAEVARHQSRPLVGRIGLGVIPSLAPYVLPKVLPALQRRYPECRVELRETLTKPLLDELLRGMLDVVMLALPVVDADVATLALFDDPFLLAAPSSDPMASADRVSARDVDAGRLILLEEGHCLRDQALAYCDAMRRDAAVGLGATSLATVMQMVANGHGVTLVPQIAADVEVRDARVKLLRFAEPEPLRKVGLAWRKTSPRRTDFLALAALMADALGVPAPLPAATTA